MNTNIRLSADVFAKLIDVFKENEWDIPSEPAGNECRFNRFCERLSILDIDKIQCGEIRANRVNIKWNR